MLRRSKRGQLFIIEIIVALSVLLILVTTLFSINTFTTPSQETNLQDRGNDAVQILVDSGVIWDYFIDANSSYYTSSTTLDSTNQNKAEIVNTIDSSLPLIADFKAFTERYNQTTMEWEQIDIINFEATIPSGSNVAIVEYYTPGFYGVFAEFKLQLFLWYEVDA